MAGKRVEIQRRSVLFDDFFRVEEARLRYERFDGTMSPVVRRLSFERGDSVAAVLVHRGRGTVVLVQQFRYPALAHGDGWLTELIAGMIDGDEQPEDAIRREILEETGYRVTDLEPLSTCFLSPGGSSERIVLFFAEVDEGDAVAPGGGAAGENEDVRVVEYGADEVFAAIERGEIADAKTILGLLWWRDRERAGRGGGPIAPTRDA